MLTKHELGHAQFGAAEGKIGESVYKRLEAALIAFATLSALLQARCNCALCILCM